MSLRKILETNSACSLAAQQITEHVTQLCSRLTPLPFFTLHNEVHLKNVELNLDKMLFPHGLACVIPQMNETEALLLLAGTWLHDIGMLRGLFEDDGQCSDDQIRDQHEKRAAKYISEYWPPAIYLGPDLQWFKLGISNIVLYHRKRHNIGECPSEIHVDGQRVRLQLLAALLRLADAAELNGERTPDFLRRLYFAMGMSAHHLEHWAKYQLVNTVAFEPQNREILIHALIPKTASLNDFDFKVIVEILAWEVQEELDTVHSVLASYEELAYRTVTPKCREVKYFPNREELVLAFSPYIVMEQPSAGTMAARFAEVLLEACAIHGHSPERLREFAEELYKRIDERRPDNVALTNVWRELQNAWSQNAAINVRNSVEQVAQLWVRQRQEAVESINTTAKLDIQPGDLLIVLGYSACVRALLAGITNHSDIHIYVAELRGRTLLPWRNEPEASEGIRMALEAKHLGYDTSFVEATWVPTFFELNRELPLCNSGRILVLCGARGIRQDGSMLNTPGHLSIASAAKTYGIPFYPVTELSKFSREAIAPPREVTPSREFADIPHSQKLREANIRIRRPYLDLVPAELITGFVTERGILKPEKISQN